MGQKMKPEIPDQLDMRERRIMTAERSRLPRSGREWGGADVIIAKVLDEDLSRWLGSQPSVVSFQTNEPRRRAVITRYSRELSWLFYRLRDIFSGFIDYASKYDFYGVLAQTAIDYLAEHESDPEPNSHSSSPYQTRIKRYCLGRIATSDR